MRPFAEKDEAARGIEEWLRSPVRRFMLIALVAAGISIVTTNQWYELFSSFAERTFERTGRRPEASWLTMFCFQYSAWMAWGVAVIPILLLGRWIASVARYWFLIALIHLPISYFAASGSLQLDTWLADVFLPERTRPEDGRRADGERRGGDRRDEDRPPPEFRQGGMRGPGEDQPLAEGERAGRRGARGDRSARGFRGYLSSREFRMPRAMAIYWVILGVGFGVSSFLRSRSQERTSQRLELDAQLLKTDLVHAQIDSLKSQIQPHFLFNALHTVGGLIREKDDRRALKMLSALGGVLRQTLDLGRTQEIRLTEELGLAERYLAIEKIRFGDRLEVAVDALDELANAAVPALILLPLVENAVRHGIEPRTEGGRVEVSAERDGDSLILEVCDDGPGFPADVLETGMRADDGRAHIGLANNRERLRVLYGDDQEFVLENGPQGGARARIRVPFKDCPDA